MEPIIIYTDRSHHETDLLCRREGWWRYHYPNGGAGGIEPIQPNFDQGFGTIMHQGTQMLMRGQLMEDALYATGMAMEGLCLLTKEPNPDQWMLIGAGLLWGIYLRVLPRIREEYDLVSIEEEFEIELARWQGSDGIERILVYQVTPDTLWRHKIAKHLVYLELKTTGWIDDNWIKSWNKKPQLHTTTWAIEQKRKAAGLEEPIEYVQIVGLYKGRKGWKQEERGLRASVFGRGWRQEGVAGILPTLWSAEERKGKGWASTSVAEYEGGIGHWIQAMPTTILDAQFPMTPPIIYRQDLVSAYLRQIVYREQEISEAKLEMMNMGPTPVLDRVWRQNFDACEASHLRFNKDCPYNMACHLRNVTLDPMASGQFRARVPHHRAEREAMAGLSKPKTP
jgi:hypothetical protein